MGCSDPDEEDSANATRSPKSVIDYSHAVTSYSSKEDYHERSEKAVKRKARPKKDLGFSYPQTEVYTKLQKTQERARKNTKRCCPKSLNIFFFCSFLVALVSAIMPISLYMEWPLSKDYPSSFMPTLRWLHSFSNESNTNLEELQATLERFSRRIEKWLERQLGLADEKLAGELEKLKSEMEVAIRDNFHVFTNQLDNMDERLKEVEEYVKIFQAKGLLNQTEAMDLINSALKEKNEVGDMKGVISLDDIRAATRRMIEAEIEKHSADGVGRVDYAIASGGGKVLSHSEGYYPGEAISWSQVSNRLLSLNHPFANGIVKPGFGEPGRCLPLKGSNVFIIIGLRTSIFAEAISLEHVSKRVAYDLTSAPKQFKVYGSTSKNENQKSSWIVLGEFTYDIYAEKYIQTFNLLNGNSAEKKISRVKLHILSNHGSQTHTCIYRVRVHGHE
ncbi:hypothetical protein SUGI_1113740 [Cryptomeria japonica]|uniref:SUN domain-containing protein 1-like n=1 Tax=Cryptomeria japonica TaxID=3369 RepID=UPI002414C089|nr:SUN domain-containing protein 1-like [Cryptomeria japonica]GLJ52353.1 hypothetical protein SUGI_1113740 [Cryptomeria japonica]